MTDFTLTATVKPEVDTDELQDQLDGGTFSMGGSTGGRQSSDVLDTLGGIKTAVTTGLIGALQPLRNLLSIDDSTDETARTLSHLRDAGTDTAVNTSLMVDMMRNEFGIRDPMNINFPWDNGGSGSGGGRGRGGFGGSGIMAQMLTEQGASIAEAIDYTKFYEGEMEQNDDERNSLLAELIDRLTERDFGGMGGDDKGQLDFANLGGLIKKLGGSLISGLIGYFSGGTLVSLASTIVGGIATALSSPIVLGVLAVAAVALATDWITKFIDGLQEKFRPEIISFFTDQLGLPKDIATGITNVMELVIDVFRDIFTLDFDGLLKNIAGLILSWNRLKMLIGEDVLEALNSMWSKLKSIFKGLGGRIGRWIRENTPEWLSTWLFGNSSQGGSTPATGGREGGDVRLRTIAQQNQTRAGQRVAETASTGLGGGANQATGSTSPTVNATIQGQTKAEVQREIERALDEFNKDFGGRTTGVR